MATDKEKRITHARKVYEYADGTEGRSAKPNWTALRIECLAPTKDKDDNFVVLETRRITREDADSWDVAPCAMGHGYSQKLGDDLAGIAKKAKDDGAAFDKVRGYADYIAERLDAMIDNFRAGVWVSESEGGGAASVTILFTAIVEAYADQDNALSDEKIAQLRERLKDEEYRKTASEVPEVKAKIEKIKADRAVERAKKAAEAAAKDGGAKPLSLL